jgi:hypothetical protein
MLHDAKNGQVCKINFFKDDNNVPENFSVHSIALSHPEFKKEVNLKGIGRLDFFCPTYDMLKRYKANNDWEAYSKDFIKLIQKRKNTIKEWMDSLKPNWVYFLCCWEDTSGGAHCHRELIHKAFKDSKVASQKIISIFREGKKIYKKTGIILATSGIPRQPYTFESYSNDNSLVRISPGTETRSINFSRTINDSPF